MTLASASLGALQNQLLAQIFAPDVQVLSRGLAAYRANALANAERALASTFPVIAQLVGEENFSFLSRDFLRAVPPQRGDMAQWGGQFASFLTEVPQLASLPFLADVAHLEWALHTCAGALDQTLDMASFAALTEHDPSELSFRLAPGACALVSAYPAVAIFLAHRGQHHGQHHDLVDRVALDAAFDLLAQGVGQTALVWRQGFVPRARLLDADEQAFTDALIAGETLTAALDLAQSDFDFSAWLTANVQNGLLLGTAVTSTPASRAE